MRSSVLGFLLASLVSCARLVAQAPAPADASAPAAAAEAAVERAVARWREVAGQPGAARTAALQQLGALADARITALLVAELAGATADADAEALLAALGGCRRQGVLEPLRRELLASRGRSQRRTAAAQAMARQGSAGIDLLLELVRSDGDDVTDEVRSAASRALAATGDERAFRGLAPLALRGASKQRLEVLRLLGQARDVPAVNQARIRLLQDSDALIAAVAWRQLAAERHQKAHSAFEDLVERLGQSPASAVCVELLEGLAHGLWADVHSICLRLMTVDDAAVAAAVRRVAAPLAADAAFVRWLLEAAVERGSAAERRVAVAVLAKAERAVLQPLIARVRKELQHPTEAALELALALGDVLQQDPAWSEDVQRLAQAPDPELRTAGLALLFDLGDGSALAEAQRAVDGKEWQLRSIAYRYLRRFRDLTSIPVLIARVGREQGRLDGELADALFAHAGVRCWSRAEWEAWWQKHKAGHQLPAAATIAASGQSQLGATVAYFGIPLVSKRTIFLLDVSGSMLQRIGTDRQRTRLSEAKKQLLLVVEKLPADQLFNVIGYAGTPMPVWDRMHKATPEDKQLVADLLRKLATGPGTNIHDALELAFADADVDTIYLLSDGEPTTGKIVDPAEIVAAVRRWNVRRQVVVHGIALGEPSPFLEELARASNGQYVIAR